MCIRDSPVRERSLERLMGMAEQLVSATGYDEISLMSLSSGDYSCLPELAHQMVEKFAQHRVKISLPSQRIDTVLTDTLKETQKVRKTALTLAPEAGTQRLRDVINKGVTEDDLMRSVTDAFEQGWSCLLYTSAHLRAAFFLSLRRFGTLKSKGGCHCGHQWRKDNWRGP